MIAILERTQSNIYQNKDKHRTPINNGRYIKQGINSKRTTKTVVNIYQCFQIQCTILKSNFRYRYGRIRLVLRGLWYIVSKYSQIKKIKHLFKSDFICTEYKPIQNNTEIKAPKHYTINSFSNHCLGSRSHCTNAFSYIVKCSKYTRNFYRTSPQS